MGKKIQQEMSAVGNVNLCVLVAAVNVVLCVLVAEGASSDPGVQLLGADDATSFTILGCTADCRGASEAEGSPGRYNLASEAACKTVMAELEAAITEAGGCSSMLSKAGIVVG